MIRGTSVVRRVCYRRVAGTHLFANSSTEV